MLCFFPLFHSRMCGDSAVWWRGNVFLPVFGWQIIFSIPQPQGDVMGVWWKGGSVCWRPRMAGWGSLMRLLLLSLQVSRAVSPPPPYWGTDWSFSPGAVLPGVGPTLSNGHSGGHCSGVALFCEALEEFCVPRSCISHASALRPPACICHESPFPRTVSRNSLKI